MYGILLSAGASILTFLLRSVLVKFVVFFGLFFIATEFIDVLVSSGILPNSSQISGSFSLIPSSVWFFLDLFKFSFGFSVLLSSFVTRFIIRRIPVIG